MLGVAAFFAMLVGGLALLAAAFGAFIWVLVHVLVFLVVLPFRILGWVLTVPFLLLKGLVMLAGGALLMLVLAVVAVALLGGLALAILAPLLPLLVIGFAIWFIARLMRRPAAA